MALIYCLIALLLALMIQINIALLLTAIVIMCLQKKLSINANIIK